MLRLDHLAISATTLAEGVDWVQSALGVTLAPGGKHPLMSTHNRLLGLGDIYLEVIARDPDVPPPAHPRWFDLDTFSGPPRLTNWIAACDDLDGALAHLPAAGVAHDLARDDLRWRMAIPPDGCLPMAGAYPALIQWHGARHPTQNLPDAGIRLTRLDIVTPKADTLNATLAHILADRRVVITNGPPALRASFATPQGTRVLG
jgi:hypothetical protein